MHSTDRVEYYRGTLMWCILYNNRDPTKIFDQLSKKKENGSEAARWHIFFAAYNERMLWEIRLGEQEKKKKKELATMVALLVFRIHFHTQFP